MKLSNAPKIILTAALLTGTLAACERNEPAVPAAGTDTTIISPATTPGTTTGTSGTAGTTGVVVDPPIVVDPVDPAVPANPGIVPPATTTDQERR